MSYNFKINQNLKKNQKIKIKINRMQFLKTPMYIH